MSDHFINPVDVVRAIEVSCLKADSSEIDIRKMCDEAKHYSFAVVFAMSSWLPLTSELLSGSGVRVGASIGFPLGSHSTFVKVMETRDAIASGAQDIDMVLNVGKLKSGYVDKVEADVRAVVEAAEGRVVKVILENCYLTTEEKRDACQICKQAGADYVKTSSCFSPSGATLEDIRLMREVVGPEMGVKAAGGIRTYEQALQFIQAGANRLGTSSGIRIAEEVKRMSSSTV